MHPSTTAILRFFEFDHLPTPLREVSEGFHKLAHALVLRNFNNRAHLDGPELTMCLRKLLEAKDCAVRAALPGHPPVEPLS